MSDQVYRTVKRRCFCWDAYYHLWPSFSPFTSFVSLFSPLTVLPISPPPLLFSPSDPLHAYLGLCGLSLIGEPNLRKVHAALNITQRAFQHLQQLQQTWRDSTGSCSRQHWQQDDPPLCLWTGSVTVVSQMDLCRVSLRRLAPNLKRGLLISELGRFFFFFFKTPVAQ